MSRPRKPFGVNHPGRLPATMMKVLAAEMSDPARLRRGKQYAKDGSVLDIMIEPGVVTCEIQGTRATPYLASIEVRAGDGMPLRRDISTTCTCPDDDNWDGYSCKHIVATMFTLSDEFLLEPGLLDVWRNRDAASDHDERPDGHDTNDDAQHDDDDGEEDGTEDDTEDHTEDGTDDEGKDEEPTPRSAACERRHLRLVTSERRETPPPRDAAPPLDRLADLIVIPEGRTLPDVPHIDRIEPESPRDRQLAAILRDAIGHLRIEWD